MVGCDTLLTAIAVLPAIRPLLVLAYSGPGIGLAPGGVPGHSGICACPVAGCQTSVFACALPHATSRNRAMGHHFMTLLRLGARPVVRSRQESGVGPHPILHAASGQPRTFSWISSGKHAGL